MRFPGFLGGGYTLDSISADAQRLVNLFPEPIESGNGRGPMCLRSTPGLDLFATCGKKSISAVAAIVAGGTGYAVNDILTVDGGTGTAATLRVRTVAAGVVTAAVVETGGAYTVLPTVTPATVTGGTGNDDATFTLTTFENTGITRTLGAITCYGVDVVAANPRVFFVAGITSGAAYLFELAADGSATNRGTLASALWSGQAFMAYNETQLYIACGPQEGFVFTFATNALTQNGVGFSPNQVAYLDGYFIANSSAAGERQRFYISALKDGTTWSLLDFTDADASPDIIVSFLTSHRELWVLGQDGIQPYFNSGNVDFPFEPIQGALIEAGCGAQASAIKLGNVLMWMGHENDGRGVVWRADGYKLVRVSTYAVEQAIRSYSGSPAGITDAVAYGYQDQGHIFYVLNFPTAGHTWVYDLTTNLWHERMYLNGSDEEAHKGICHCFAFWEATPFKGKHLVGARDSGKIYELSTTFLDDDGDTIQRIRRYPHLSNEEKWTYYHSLQVDTEAGLAVNQRLKLRWSNDGGKTFGDFTTVDAGITGRPIAASAVAAIVNAGASYTAGQILTTTGGTGTQATIRVLTVDGSGAILTAEMATFGAWTVAPTNPVSVTTGAATFTLTFTTPYYRSRAVWRRLGRARDRVFELQMEDSVKWTLTECYVNLTPSDN